MSYPHSRQQILRKSLLDGVRSSQAKIPVLSQEDAAVEEQAVFAVPDFPVETALADEGFYPLEAAPPKQPG